MPRSRATSSEQGRLVASATASRLGRRHTTRRATALVVESAAARGGSRSPASATSLGVGRKTAQLLLERFDADGLTRRVGDERVLRRRGTIAQ